MAHSPHHPPPSWQQAALARLFKLLRWLEQFRYVKFGIVGASGTVVNLIVLFIGREYLFVSIEGHTNKPYFSLAVAIAIATLNNFTWNRLWTWADRRMNHQTDGRRPSLVVQFAKYATASWFGIALQYSLTLWLTTYMHYMVANVIAIAIASVSNFLANDHWTFRRRKAR